MSNYKDNLTDYEKECIKALEDLKVIFSDPNYNTKVLLKYMEDHIRKNQDAIDEICEELGLFDEEE